MADLKDDLEVGIPQLLVLPTVGTVHATRGIGGVVPKEDRSLVIDLTTILELRKKMLITTLTLSSKRLN